MDNSTATLTIAPASRVGDFIFLAGQIATDVSTWEHATGDLSEQTAKIFTLIEKILRDQNSSLDDVVKLTTYFAVPLNREVAEEYWAVRREFFGGRAIPSTGVQVVALSHGALLEVEAIAYVGRSSSTEAGE